MKKEMIELYPEYKDVFYSDCITDMISAPYVIFLDGKDATKHHKKDMLSEHGFTYNLYKAACELIDELRIECHIYAVMDEITFIFKNGKTLANTLNETNEDYVLSLFTLKFFEKFAKYDHCLFKGCIYPIDPSHVDKIIEFRKTVGYNTALIYFAKEYIPATERHGKSYDEVITLLKKHGIYDRFIEKHFLYEGFYAHLNTIKKLKLNTSLNIVDVSPENIIMHDEFGFPV